MLSWPAVHCIKASEFKCNSEDIFRCKCSDWTRNPTNIKGSGSRKKAHRSLSDLMGSQSKIQWFGQSGNTNISMLIYFLTLFWSHCAPRTVWSKRPLSATLTELLHIITSSAVTCYTWQQWLWKTFVPGMDGSILASAAFILTWSVTSNFLKARREITEEPSTGINHSQTHREKPVQALIQTFLVVCHPITSLKKDP